eukprot:g1032.t1
MPNGRRKVPFSGKQKKEQLKARKARKQHERLQQQRAEAQQSSRPSTVATSGHAIPQHIPADHSAGSVGPRPVTHMASHASSARTVTGARPPRMRIDALSLTAGGRKLRTIFAREERDTVQRRKHGAANTLQAVPPSRGHALLESHVPVLGSCGLWDAPSAPVPRGAGGSRRRQDEVLPRRVWWPAVRHIVPPRRPEWDSAASTGALDATEHRHFHRWLADAYGYCGVEGDVRTDSEAGTEVDANAEPAAGENTDTQSAPAPCDAQQSQSAHRVTAAMTRPLHPSSLRHRNDTNGAGAGAGAGAGTVSEIVIFLDVDGVLHPYTAPANEHLAEPQLRRLWRIVHGAQQLVVQAEAQAQAQAQAPAQATLGATGATKASTGHPNVRVVLSTSWRLNAVSRADLVHTLASMECDPTSSTDDARACAVQAQKQQRGIISVSGDCPDHSTRRHGTRSGEILAWLNAHPPLYTDACGGNGTMASHGGTSSKGKSRVHRHRGRRRDRRHDLRASDCGYEDSHHSGESRRRWIAIDDEDLLATDALGFGDDSTAIKMAGHVLRVDGERGLQDSDVERALTLLRGDAIDPAAASPPTATPVLEQTGHDATPPPPAPPAPVPAMGFQPRELCHFEHNIEVWRQLWRVVERSHIIIMVADVRCPLLHINEAFVRALLDGSFTGDGSARSVVVCLNKCDLVPTGLVDEWVSYFEHRFARVLPRAESLCSTPGVLKVVSFSAHPNRITSANSGRAGRTSWSNSGVRARVAQPKRYMATPETDEGVVALMRACGCEPVDSLTRHHRDAPGSAAPSSARASDTGERERQSDADHARGLVAKTVLQAPSPERNPVSAESSGTAGLVGRAQGNSGSASAHDSGDETRGKLEDTSSDDGDSDGDSDSDSDSDSDDGLLALARNMQRASARDVPSDTDDDDDDDTDDEPPVEQEPSACESLLQPDVAAQQDLLPMVGGDQVGDLVVGLIGQPNAGKTSVMNRLVGSKVASESRSAGHTKYFQTMPLPGFCVVGTQSAEAPPRRVFACDCPGLVFAAPANGPGALPRPLQELFGMFPAAQVREPFSAIRVLAQGVSLPLMYKLVPPADDEQGDAVPQLGQHLSALDQSLSELPKFSEWRRMGAQKRLGFEELWLDAHDQLRALLSGAESDDVLRWIREPDNATALFTVLQHSVQSGPLAAAKAVYLKRADVRHAQVVLRLLAAVASLDVRAASSGAGIAFSAKQRSAFATWRAAALTAGASDDDIAATSVSASVSSAYWMDDTGQPAGDSDRGTTVAPMQATGACGGREYDWSPLSLCSALAEQRGLLMSRTGLPDVHSAGIAILHDCQDGLLPFALVPPPQPQSEALEKDADAK